MSRASTHNVCQQRGWPMRTHSTRHSLFHVLAGLAIAALPLVSMPAHAVEVTSIQVNATDDETVVNVVLSDGAEGAAVSTFTMSNPDRVVIDIADATMEDDVADVEATGSLVERIEVESIRDAQGTIGRIEVFLAGPVEHTVAVDGGSVRLTLTSLSGFGEDEVAEALDDELEVPFTPSGPDQLVDGPTISSLDFKYKRETNSVLIGLHRLSGFDHSQPNAKTILIDIPGAYVPQSLRRVLDIGEFMSPVRMVRAYPTSRGARVAITLRREVEFRVFSPAGTDLIIAEFQVPQDMRDEYVAAHQDYSSVGPSSPDAAIRNAYQEEIVIGMGGRTLSPQTAWGRGGGSRDPASLLGMASGFMFDSSSATAMPYAGRRISLDFVNADIHSIFRLISHVSRLNIVSGDDVAGTVTVRMEDVPWDQALAAVLQAKGLGSQRFGNIVRVAPIETIKAEQQSALEAKRAHEELQDLSLLVVPLDFASAPGVQQQVSALVSQRGTVEVDKRGNQLIVKETEARLAQIRELIRHLDKQTPQVLIEARVVEANSSYTRSLGIQWGGEMDASTNTGYSTGLFFPNNVGASGGIARGTDGQALFYSANQDNLLVDLGPEGSSGAMSFHLGSIPGLIDLDARLAAMESDGFGKVISSPRVTTVDNTSASILQGQKIPFLSTSAGGTQVKYINAALELSVTPHITTDNKVKLAVSVKNDRADFSVLVQGQPAISIKQISTELMVQDGDTTVIGGVFATEESGNKKSVPGFSKIPLLGFLFKNSTRSTTRNELLVFITPRIVTRGIVTSD
jgi:type IV pilus assembly protein PilQ